MSDKHEFPEAEKKGLYRAIYERRDVRGQFKPDPVPEDVLARILDAAHHAGSVGFMQPWNFIIVRDRITRDWIKDVFEKERQRAALLYEEPKRSKFLSLKLEGITDSPVNLCVTCDPTRGGPHVLGRSAIPETDVYSTCCAIENLWLAARAEGLGVGWVSIFRIEELKQILQIPEHIIVVAYLCLGYVTGFLDRPELELAGWRSRYPLSRMVFCEKWGVQEGPEWEQLIPAIKSIDS